MIQNIFSTAKHMRGTQQQYIKEGDGRQQAICKQYNHCFYHDLYGNLAGCLLI